MHSETISWIGVVPLIPRNESLEGVLETRSNTCAVSLNILHSISNLVKCAVPQKVISFVGFDIFLILVIK